jgi:hypothetical protein
MRWVVWVGRRAGRSSVLRRSLAAGGATLIVTFVLLWPAGAARASSSKGNDAWWNMTPASVVPVIGSTSPVTPKGGMQVTWDGSSTTAFGAVRYVAPLKSWSGSAISAKSVQAVLTLTLDAKGNAGTPVLDACPTTSPWKPGGDQPAKKAPKYRCTGGHAAKGQFNASSNTVTWNLAFPQESTTSPGVFSIAIVPAPKLGPKDAFNAEFDKPSSGDFTVTSYSNGSGGSGSAGYGGGGYAPPPGSVASGGSSPVPSGGGSGATFSSPAAPGSSYSPSGSSGVGGASSFGSSSPSGSVGGSSTSSGGGSGSGSGSGSGTGTASSPTGPQALGSALPTRNLSSTAGRNLALALLIALGVGAASLSGRHVRKARLLVPIAAKASPAAPAGGSEAEAA